MDIWSWIYRLGKTDSHNSSPWATKSRQILIHRPISALPVPMNE